MSSIRNDHGHFATRAVHAGQIPDPTTGAVMTPVYLTSTYAQPSPAELVEGHDYSRTINPTRTALQENLASLEQGNWGLCFSSGMAACSALLSRLSSGDHVVTGDDLYGGTYRVFDKVFKRYGIEFTFVDTTQAAEVKRALRPNTKLVFVETPTNPLLRLVDIAALAEVAHGGSALLAVDNTFATPYLQRPLEHGADVVLHSLTKYLGGHSDVVAGALVGRDEGLCEELAFLQNSIGSVPGILDCFLVLRGTKTLHVRMDRHCDNAERIASFLEEHEQVQHVIYPGLSSHPQHAVAKKQMDRAGGMVSFELKGSVAAANALASSTKVFTLAESLGGVESLIEVPTSMTHASIPPEVRRAAGLADGLVRLSVGIEDVDDQLADLEQALEFAKRA